MTTDQDEGGVHMLNWVKAIAKEQHVILNPDIAIVNRVIRGLSANKEKYGRPYCPCRVRSGNAETDVDIECPCKYMNSEIIAVGRCTCLLYYKEE